MKNLIIKNILLIIIIIIGFILRFFDLGAVPIAPDWDEVSHGYNAYSIIQTGRDEYGEFFPFVLRSFDDYKPALYTYLTIPAVFIFGLNAFAVRLPSALLGMAAILSVYFFVNQFMKKFSVIPIKNVRMLSLISSLLLAISPWHIQFSRIAFEASSGMALNLLGAIFFLKGLKKTRYFLLSSVFFGLNIYMYQSNKVFTPILIFALVIIFLNEIKLFKNKKSVYLSALLFMLIIMPMGLYHIADSQAAARAKGVSIFNDNSLLKRNVEHLIRSEKKNNYIEEILDNRRIEQFKIIVGNYYSHFDLKWLFITGDSVNRHHAPNMGLMYLSLLPFFLFGIYKVFMGNIFTSIRPKIFLAAWVMIVPIPAMVTTGTPSSVRTLNFLPILEIFIAFGIFYAYSFLLKKDRFLFIKAAFLFIPFFLFGFNLIYFLKQYFIQQNFYYSQDWQYGYEEAVSFLEKKKFDYDKVVVSTVKPMDQSYMFFLFYTKYDPKKYLDEGGTVSKNAQYKNDIKFDKYSFKEFNYFNEKNNTLLVGSSSDFQEEFKVIKRIYFKDGTEAMRIVEKR